MLSPRSVTTVEYDLWRLDIPYSERVTDELDYGEFSETRLMPSLTTVVCVLASLIFFQPFIVLHSCTLVIFKQNTCVRLVLLLVFLSTLPVFPGRSMLMVLMALHRRIWWAAIQMSRVTPFLRVHERWVLFYSSITFLASLNPCPNTVLFQFSLLWRSTRSLFGLRGTSSWRWPSIPGSYKVVKVLVMMMMMMVMVVKVQSWLQAISRGRGISSDPVNRQTNTDTESIA